MVDTGELPLEGRSIAGRYLLEEEVAAGGMGAVWRARDRVLGRPVAVKVLHDRLASDPEVLERFRLEAVAAARLSHPNVVRVFDTGIDDGVCFIVMELFEGSTLEDLLQRDGALSAAEAARIVRGMLHGLAHAHRQGVIHRDVKPANVLLDRSGLVKVTDFGIAKAAFASSDLTTTGELLGTARYLAPEQVAGGDVDHRADLYASGVVLYEGLTGRPPFQADTHIATATMRLTKEPPPPGALRPGVPRGLEAVTMRALAREPAERFQTAAEMGAALDRTIPSPGPRQPARPASPASRGGSTFRSWMAVPLILVLVAAVAVIGFTLIAPLFEGDEGGGGDTVDEVRFEPIPIDGAVDYDPYGDNRSENPDAVSSAHDGDSSTAWTTEGYEQIDLGGKGGVGLAIDVGDTRDIAAVALETDIPGWRFQLHAGDQVEGLDGSEPLPSDGGTTFTASDRQRILLDEPVEARYVLIWITQLGESDAYRASVSEVKILGPGG